MPYRDQATVEGWLRDYIASHPEVSAVVSVLNNDFTAGPDSGLVVVSLSNASTLTYIQPVLEDGSPVWMVNFEARNEAFSLDAAGVARLSSDLATIADICAHLQARMEAAIAESAHRGDLALS